MNDNSVWLLRRQVFVEDSWDESYREEIYILGVFSSQGEAERELDKLNLSPEERADVDIQEIVMGETRFPYGW